MKQQEKGNNINNTKGTAKKIYKYEEEKENNNKKKESRRKTVKKQDKEKNINMK